MVDPNFQDFYGRIARIERGRANGYGFEAPGTYGLSHYRVPPRRRFSVIGPALVILAMAVVLKGAILYEVGAATYDQRVADLRAGEGFDRLGAVLMQADPATVWVSDVIRDLLH